VAPVDGTTETAKGLHQIDERFSLSQPYGSPDLPLELAEIVAAWPTLPDVIRACIVATVKAATHCVS